MTDFRDIEVKSGNQSFMITLGIGLLSLLLLLISFSFETKDKKNQPIEIAMNFGNTDLGKGEEEPAPAKSDSESASAPNNNDTEIEENIEKPTTVEEPKKETPPARQAVTQNTKEDRVSAVNKKQKKVDNKAKSNSTTAEKSNKKSSSNKSTSNANNSNANSNQGDSRANDALSNILGGKGKAQSSGQGSSNTAGNVGDPKGSDSYGTSIGEDWKSKIPEPQQHNCSASGTIVVEIIVNSAGNIKSAIPGVKGSTSSDACLKSRAKELVLKYVKANPGADGRKGFYKVNLR